MTPRIVLAAAVSLAFAGSAALAQTAAKPAAKKPAAEKALPQADQTQLDAAERVLYGPYDCDQKQTIEAAKNAKSAGYVDVKFKNQTWTMKPSVSSTGAVNMDDVKGQTRFMQIGNKSMLFDVKAGRRLVDACVHEKQRAAAEAAAK